MTNNRAPLLYYIKLCASFQIHRWIQTGVTVRKRSIQVKIGNFWSRVTLKLTTGHLFYATSSFVHHFKATSKFKVKSQSRKTWFGSKSAIFCPMWPWNLTDDLEKTIGHPFYVASSFVHHFRAISEIHLVLQSGKAQFGSKSTIFFSHVALKFDRWPWKTIGHLF